MDFFSRATVPKRLYLYSIFPFNWLVKLGDWLVHQRAEIDPNHHAKVLLQGSTHSYHGLLSRTKLCPNRCYLTFFHIPRRSIALVKTTGSPKGWNDQPAPLTKCYSGSTRSYIHGWTSNRTKLCFAVAIFLYSQTFNCTSKTTGWFTKGWNWSNLPANKVLLKGIHAFLYTWMDFFQCIKLCPSRCYLTFFHIPERSIGLVKRLAGSPKDWNWSTITGVTQGSTHSYIWMDFFQSHKL
jgi:hypothetical protein